VLPRQGPSEDAGRIEATLSQTARVLGYRNHDRAPIQLDSSSGVEEECAHDLVRLGP
jgi:hypothetical protein